MPKNQAKNRRAAPPSRAHGRSATVVRSLRYKNRLGGHTNGYHTYSLEEALDGIAAAGYKYVELSAVPVGPSMCRSMPTKKHLAKFSACCNQRGLSSRSVYPVIRT